MATDNLLQVLDGYTEIGIHPEEWFLNQALIAATLTDNYETIGKLIRLGAKNIDECIELAHKKRVVNAMAMLLLMKAALTGDKNILYSVIGTSLKPEFSSTFKEASNDALIVNLASAVVLKRRACILLPLHLAQINGHYCVIRELLMLEIYIDKQEGSIDWSDLSLVSLDTQLLEASSDWLKLFLLTANKLRSLPKEIGMLKKVTHMDLSYNCLTTIPAALLELPKLVSLVLSHNSLSQLPQGLKWSAKLSDLNLSNNRLSCMPRNVSALGITSLNLCGNCLNQVPLSVCEFAALKYLDLRDNPNLKFLPPDISILNNLMSLQLNGKMMESLVCKTMTQENPLDHIPGKLKEYSKGSLCTQLMIVGNDDRDKCAFAAILQGTKKKHKSSKITVSEWAYRPNKTKKVLQFHIWLFSNLNSYTSTHNWVLSKHSLHLVLFNLKHGSEGVHELKPWLDSIAHRAPYSSVVIIGTHTNDIPKHHIDFLLQQARLVGATYGNKPEIVALLSFGMEDHSGNNISHIRELIYESALNYPFLQKAIIYAIERNHQFQKIEDLLKLLVANVSAHKLVQEPQFLNYALEVAIKVDNPHVIGVLVQCGATSVESYMYSNCTITRKARCSHYATFNSSSSNRKH